MINLGLFDKFYNKLKSYPAKRIPIFDSPSKEWQDQHNEVSSSIRRTMLILIVFSLFCILALGDKGANSGKKNNTSTSCFSENDKNMSQLKEIIMENAAGLKVRNGKLIKVPFADTQVKFIAFLAVGPLILIVLTFYLHVLYGYLLRLGCYDSSTKLPYIFNISFTSTRIITNGIFYWLTPLVLLVFMFSSPCLESIMLYIITNAVIVILSYLQIRRFRWNENKNIRQSIYFILLVTVMFAALIALVLKSVKLYVIFHE